MTKIQQILIIIMAMQLTGCAKTILFNSGHKSNCIGINLPKISNPIRIEGKAEYKRRVIPEEGKSGLGEIDDRSYPIRFAEVEVLSNNETTYCTSTNEFGEFVVEIPNTGSNHTVKVNSLSPKSANQIGNVFVQNNPLEDNHYAISKSISRSNSKPVYLIASANGAGVLGGAFNILDKVIQANLFLSVMTTDCGNECEPFDSSPPAYLYWEAGIDPLKNFLCNYKKCNPATDKELSFFDRDSSQIYILGGTNGDIRFSDTDHFDDAVIIHEYFHFVLTNTINLFSPGGEHESNTALDPRLALSEGLANGLAVLVLENPSYVDTVGIGSDGAIKVRFNAESSTAVAGDEGVGNFIESAITRAIWDMLDPVLYNDRMIGSNDNDNVTIGFTEFWGVLTGEFASEEYHFKDYGLLMGLLNERPNATTVDEILDREMQKSNREDYASEYDPCITYELLTPINHNNNKENTYVNTNQFYSNDFYMYKHEGGVFSANLDYSNSHEANLDMYVYREFYTFGKADDLAGFSNRENDGGEEITQISDLPSGVYMINIVSIDPAQRAEYRLSLNGEQCLDS